MTGNIISVDFGAAEALREKELRNTLQFVENNDVTAIICGHMEKRPTGKEWQRSSRRNHPTIFHAIKQELNVGLLLKEVVVDIDIDDIEVLGIAEHLLPSTSRYGRFSKPDSHWLYTVEGNIEFATVGTASGHIEIRTGNHQSLAPGSIHPSGELYSWEDSSVPTRISPCRLSINVRLLAAASILCKRWVSGHRDELAVAVSGVLLRSGYSVKDINRLIHAVCRICFDEQGRSRLKANRLKRALSNREKVPGIPALRRILGTDTRSFLDAIGAQVGEGNSLSLVRADRINPEPVQWLWNKRFALGKLTMLVGDPGASKSTVALDIAARVTTGRPFPDGTPSHGPGDVILITAEDDAADTIVPRFMAAKGDRSRLHLFGEGFGLQADKERLVNAIQRLPRPMLVIFDPITEYISAKNPGDMLEARQKLAPLVDLIREMNIACIAISHLNKDQAQSAIYRTTGSVAFVAVARAVYLVVKDASDLDRRFMLPIKNNLGPDQSGLAYTIQETTVEGISTTAMVWEQGEIAETADQLLSNQSVGKFSPKLDQASDWLSNRLFDGPVSKKILESDANTAGISKATLRRAKADLGVISIKKGEPGEGGHWEWALT